MTKRQETCKQQCCHQIFNECNIGTGWNTLPNCRHKRYKRYQQGRYRYHSFWKLFCLKIDSQVQNCQQPQWEENYCNWIHWVLVQRNHDECVFVRCERLLLFKKSGRHSFMLFQVVFFLFCDFLIIDIPLFAVFTEPIIFLTHLSKLRSQHCVLFQAENFFQVIKKFLIFFLLLSLRLPAARLRIPITCEIFEFLITQHFVIVVTDVHFRQNQSIMAKLIDLTDWYFWWTVLSVHEVEINAESSFFVIFL